jgi:hypothetical protein
MKVPNPSGRKPIELSTGTRAAVTDSPFPEPGLHFITRSRLALTGKARLPYKPRDFEQVGNPLKRVL